MLLMLLLAARYQFVCGSSGYIGTKGNYIKVVAKKSYISTQLRYLQCQRRTEIQNSLPSACLPACVTLQKQIKIVIIKGEEKKIESGDIITTILCCVCIHTTIEEKKTVMAQQQTTTATTTGEQQTNDKKLKQLFKIKTTTNKTSTH